MNRSIARAQTYMHTRITSIVHTAQEAAVQSIHRQEFEDQRSHPHQVHPGRGAPSRVRRVAEADHHSGCRAHTLVRARVVRAICTMSSQRMSLLGLYRCALVLHFSCAFGASA